MIKGKILLPLVLFCLCLGAMAQPVKSEKELWQNYKDSKDSGNSVSVLIELSKASYQRDRQYSEKLAAQAYELSKKLSSKELEAKALICLTNVVFENSKNVEAVDLTADLLKLTEPLPDRWYYSEACRIAGRNYHLRGDYSMALDFYFKGLKYCEEANDTIQAGEMYNIIGGVYLNQLDYKNAFYYYNKSLQIQIKKNNKLRIGRGYLNISNIYTAGKNFQKALEVLDSSMVNYTRANYEEGRAMVHTTLPEIYIALNQDDSALKYLYLAFDYLKRVNRTYYITQLDLQIARILLKRNKTGEALNYIEDGIEVGRKNRQNHDLIPLYLLKSEVLDKQGKTQEAFASYKFYKTFSDSVLNAASIKKQTEEALKYDFDKQKYQRELEEQEQRSRQRLLVLGSIIIVAILFLVFYYRYRLKQKANQQLEQAYSKLAEKNLLVEQKSTELRESLGERELLLKEIHHRVKNNLQVISGLLELQKEELTEDGSKAAFDEGQSRIRSISLIHQNLYQNEKLGSIKFKVFVEELCEQVQEVFEEEHKEMKVSIEMPDHILDIDTAVPLGLVLNELLTNSYKYAASKTLKGIIKIILVDNGAGNFTLTYSDNGPGIKAGTNFESASTLGLRLIKGLSAQLAGKASYRFENGPVFEIVFKDAKARMND